MKNIKVVSDPYINDGDFKTLSGDTISYSHLCIDVQVGSQVLKLKRSLKGLEKEYVKGLIEQDKVDPDFIEE